MKIALKFLFSLLCTSLLIYSCQKESSITKSVITANKLVSESPFLTGVNLSITDNIAGFYESTPVNYNLGNTHKYPLLIFLHDVDQTGNGRSDLSKLLSGSLPSLINQKKFPSVFRVKGDDFSFIVLSPQFKQWPQASDIDAMIDYAVKNLRVDITRIYIAGVSMGGGAAIDYATVNPNRVAAVVSVSGAMWLSRERCGIIANAHLPVWAFHNSDDTIIDVSATTSIVGNINSFNPKVEAKQTIWPAGGHDAWTKATDPASKECNGKNIYEWMLQFSRSASN